MTRFILSDFLNIYSKWRLQVTSIERDTHFFLSSGKALKYIWKIESKIIKIFLK